jgi:predicted subunit of tRNA(5-methylaminomethyl-2-thiouridylate) methyltransferase
MAKDPSTGNPKLTLEVKDNVLTIVAEHISPENAVTLMMTAVEEIATTELSRITGTTREEVLAMVDKEIEDAENHS